MQLKTHDDRQRKCPKHGKFYSKNKFEILINLGGFIIRIYHDARSPELQFAQDVRETRMKINIFLEYISY